MVFKPIHYQLLQASCDAFTATWKGTCSLDLQITDLDVADTLNLAHTSELRIITHLGREPLNSLATQGDPDTRDSVSGESESDHLVGVLWLLLLAAGGDQYDAVKSVDVLDSLGDLSCWCWPSS